MSTKKKEETPVKEVAVVEVDVHAECKSEISALQAEIEKLLAENAELAIIIVDKDSKISDLEKQVDELMLEMASELHLESAEKKQATCPLVELTEKWEYHLNKKFKLDQFLDYFPAYFVEKPVDLELLEDGETVKLIY